MSENNYKGLAFLKDEFEKTQAKLARMLEGCVKIGGKECSALFQGVIQARYYVDLSIADIDDAIQRTTAVVENSSQEAVLTCGTDSTVESSDIVKRSDNHVISSADGLAKYLGCSHATAFKIINKKVLPKNVQYMTGRVWKFNREKLDQFLASNPEALRNLWER